MNVEPTTTISLDYLVEFIDDGEQPEEPDLNVIAIPPAPVALDEMKTASTESSIKSKD